MTMLACPLCGGEMTAIETYPGRGELYCGHCDLTIGGNDAKTPEELEALIGQAKGFRWRMMDEEKPETGEMDCIIAGRKGGMRLAKGYGRHAFDGSEYFYMTSGDRGRERVYADRVMAWAEIPACTATNFK